MKKYWENVLNSKNRLETSKQININNYLDGNIGIESVVLSNVEDDLYSSEVLSDVLKENPDEIPDNINSVKDVPGGVPSDPSKMGDDDTSSDDSPEGGEDSMDADMDTGDNTDEEGDDEDEPQYQLNKNEFATELGMRYLTKIFVDLSVSIELSIKKLQSVNTKVNVLGELEELKQIVDDTTELITITNIWETQTKYYLYIDRYRQILKGCGIEVSVKDLTKKNKPRKKK